MAQIDLDRFIAGRPRDLVDSLGPGSAIVFYGADRRCIGVCVKTFIFAAKQMDLRFEVA